MLLFRIDIMIKYYCLTKSSKIKADSFWRARRFIIAGKLIFTDVPTAPENFRVCQNIRILS